MTTQSKILWNLYLNSTTTSSSRDLSVIKPI